jgi:hypothetical protein
MKTPSEIPTEEQRRLYLQQLKALQANQIFQEVLAALSVQANNLLSEATHGVPANVGEFLSREQNLGALRGMLMIAQLVPSTIHEFEASLQAQPNKTNAESYDDTE